MCVSCLVSYSNEEQISFQKVIVLYTFLRIWLTGHYDFNIYGFWVKPDMSSPENKKSACETVLPLFGWDVVSRRPLTS